MKKTLLTFGILLPSITVPAAIGVHNSGIDWGDSTLTVTSFIAADPSVLTFSCFGASAVGVPVTLGSVFGAATGPASESGGAIAQTKACETAGDYVFDLTLEDEAGNPSTVTNYKLSIFPGDASTVAIDTTDCGTTTDAIFANNVDGCDFNIVVRDQYTNVFGGFNDGSANHTDTSDVDISVTGKVNRTTFDYLDETEDSDDLFRDGVNVPSGLSLNRLGTFPIPAQITSVAPSIDILEGASSSDVNARVSRLQAKTINLDFAFQEVDETGELIPLAPSMPVPGVASTLAFKPWVMAELLDPDGDVSNGLETLEIDKDGSLLRINLLTGGTNPNLPSGLDVELLAMPPDSVDMLLDKVAADFDVLAGTVSDLSNGKTFAIPDTAPTHSIFGNFLKLVKAPGIAGILEWGLATKITHTVDGNNIVYPGGNFGGTPFAGVSGFADYPGDLDCLYCDTDVVGGSINFIGADIEGQVMSSQDIFGLGQKSGDGSVINVGGVSVQDTREELMQSAYALYRGLAPLPLATEQDLTAGIDFTEEVTIGIPKYKNGVAYYKGGTVSIGGTIEGVGTIIIEDGNLVIEDDMVYSDKVTDSLGIILVNSKFQGAPADSEVLATGNIFIRSDIKKMVGTYFSDGSLLSVLNNTIPVSPPTYTYPSAIGDLDNQLLLDGIVFSYNTFGGSEVMNDLNQYSTPWGIVPMADKAVATKYDIHHIRRYGGGGALAFCVTNTNNGAACDTNHFAFVIRPDGKVQNMTPPGFGAASSSYR